MVSCRGLNAPRTEGDLGPQGASKRRDARGHILSMHRRDPTTGSHLGISGCHTAGMPIALKITSQRVIKRGAGSTSLQKQHPPGAPVHFAQREMVRGAFQILFQKGDEFFLPFAPALHREFLSDPRTRLKSGMPRPMANKLSASGHAQFVS